MYDREKVEQIKESLTHFIQNQEEYPSTEALAEFLESGPPETLIALYELAVQGNIIHNPKEDVWHFIPTLSFTVTTPKEWEVTIEEAEP